MKLDNFTVFLGIGLGIIFIAFLVTNYNVPIEGFNLGGGGSGGGSFSRGYSGGYYSDSDYSNRARVIENTDSKYNYIAFGNYEIGPLNTKTLDFKRFNFASGSQLSSEDTLYSGILMGVNLKVIKFKALDDSKIELSFNIENTNNVAPIYVELNNKEIYNNYLDPGNHKLMFDVKGSENENILEFGAKSSGIFFWVPNVYEIKEFEFKLNGASGNKDTINIDISDVYENAENSKISLDGSDKGKLKIIFNDEEIFNGESSGFEIVDIDKSKLKKINTIQFQSIDGEHISGEFVFITEYLNKDPANVHASFNLVGKNFYTDTKIGFEITDIIKHGAVKVSILDVNEEETFSTIQGIRESYYEIDVPRNALTVTENMIILEGLDGAEFSIEDFEFLYK